MTTTPSIEKRASAVRYWESRRLGFNLMLITPGVCGWLGYLSTAVGPTALTSLSAFELILPLGLTLVAINILYSAVYCVEFLLMCDGESDYWLARGRDLTFAAGSVAVVGMAFLGGAGFAAHFFGP